MEDKSAFRRNSFFWSIYILISLLYLVFGSIHLDEGAYLYASGQVYSGQMPYRDFFFLQPPMFPYVYGLIQVFLPGLLFARLTSILFGLLTTVMLMKLAGHLSDRHGATVFLALMTMAPFQLYFFTIARLYSLTAFFLSAGALLLCSKPRPEMKHSVLGLCMFGLALGTRLTTAPLFLLACLYILITGISFKQKLIPPVAAGCLVAALYAPFVIAAGPERFYFNIAGMNLSLHANNLQASFIQKGRATVQLLRFYFPVWLMLVPLVTIFFRDLVTTPLKRIIPVLTGHRTLLWVMTIGMLTVHSTARLYQVSYQTIIMPLLFCLVAAQWRTLYMQSGTDSRRLYRGLFTALWILGLLAYGRTSLSVIHGKPALMALWEQATFVKMHTQPDDVIFSADSPLVPAESRRRVLPGMAGSDLFPDWSSEQCRYYRVLNFDIMNEYIRNQKASLLVTGDMSFNLSLPHLEPVPDSDRHALNSAIDAYYETAAIFPNLMLPGTQTYYRVPRKTSVSRPEKLLVFGIDAIGWDILLPLIETDMLPGMKRLFETGTSAYMKTMDPTVSVVLWTTMATGLLPERHGIDNWLAQSDDSSGQQAITSDRRKAHAFWNLTGDKKISVVNWWATWPVEPVNGLMISNRAHYSDLYRAVHPEEATPLIANYKWKTVRDIEKELTALNPLESTIELPDFIAQMLLRDRFYLDMAYQSLLHEGDIDILAVFVRGIDILGHEYLRDVRVDATGIPEVPAGQKGVVRAYYRYLDQWLEKFLNAMGPNTGVIVVSDHGMEPVDTLPPLIEGLQLDKLLAAIAESSGDHTLTADFLDNMRYPIGLKRGISWSPESTMPPTRADRLADILESIHFGSGEKLFIHVERSTDQDEIITLTLNPAPGFQDVLTWQQHRIPVMSVTGMIIHPRSGQHWHAPDGIYMMSGPGIPASGLSGKINIYDIMPTFMAWMGFPVSRDLDGQPQTRFFRGDFSEHQPIEMVDSYGHFDRLKPASVPLDIDKDVRRELESLGYIFIQ